MCEEQTTNRLGFVVYQVVYLHPSIHLLEYTTILSSNLLRLSSVACYYNKAPALAPELSWKLLAEFEFCDLPNTKWASHQLAPPKNPLPNTLLIITFAVQHASSTRADIKLQLDRRWSSEHIGHRPVCHIFIPFFSINIWACKSKTLLKHWLLTWDWLLTIAHSSLLPKQ